MKVDIKPGTYVVAVSGGVDSMALLDVLSKEPGLQLIVAHFDHGMRAGSDKDRQFVQSAAEQYGLPFVFSEGRLGKTASEETARNARYSFLQKTKKAAGADAVMTAHHQDDVLETAIINLLRGTGRRGLTALKSGVIVRPLLGVSKKDITSYAKKHKLKWREDPTNQYTDYLRNYVRHEILPKFDGKAQAQLLAIITKLRVTNTAMDELIADILKSQTDKHTLDRQLFITLSHAMSKEVMAAWLRQNGVSNYDSKTLERLVRAAKTYQTGKKTDINDKAVLEIGKHELKLAL